MRKPSKPLDPVVMPERWIHLMEACKMKGVCYNSVARVRDAWRQPNCGKEDGIISGRKAWRPETVRAWILLDDMALKKIYHQQIKEMAKKEVLRLKK